MSNCILNRISSPGRVTHFLLSATALIAIGASQSLIAQEADEATSTSSALLEEVVVTARKREESAQDVPIMVTAYSSNQLEALKIRDLSNLSVGIPNVAMDDIGTFKTVANFSIRGLGINSSIPSIDPTVGVFVDGVYMGQNAGMVIDMFDIESIEVLRGPQGTLFGRNVTGGAILINTKGPTDELEYSARAALDGNPNGDGGLNRYIMGSVSGPLGDNFGFRLSIYNNTDDGWFVNLFDGKNFGKANTTIFRPVLQWNPNDDVQVVLRYERTESDGDGPAAQSHTNGRGIPGFWVNFERDSFDFSIDERGFYDFTTDFLTLQVDWDVNFGDGTITNIFGWRKFESSLLSDIDASPQWLFHAPAWNNSEQFSNELRFNGDFGETNVTAGFFWFTNEVNYHERRNLLGIATGGVAPALTQDGGGDYNVDSIAVFSAFDYAINDAWSLIGGIRYTYEEKAVKIASLSRNVNSPCNITKGTCPFDFIDDDSWSAFSGKLGFAYAISDEKRLYAHWSRSQRSGGYNLRNTATDTVNFGPGPFDQETVDNFEFGFKSELGGRGRINAAVFYNKISDMQREVGLTSPISGVIQLIRNTADAEIFGFEFDGTFLLGEGTLLMTSIGWINPQYTNVKFDLNGDGVVDAKDEDLKLPRAAEVTASIGITHDTELGDWGYMTWRASYAYRDNSFTTDNNLGRILEQDIVDAGIDFHTASRRWTFSLYGRNLANSVKIGTDTQLPPKLGPVPLGGTFGTLARGAVVGVEVTFNN